MHALDIDPSYPGARIHDVENGLPFSDTSVDLIWCTEVIEHLRDPEYFLREVERVMRPGGMAVFTTPNSHWWFYWVVQWWGWTPQNLQNPDHKQFFSEQSIRTLAPEYQLIGYFPYALFFMPIKRAIGMVSPTFVFLKKF